MPGLPKIALTRLKAKAARGQSSAPGLKSPGFEGGAHPDANLLAAFAENSLTGREREQVLDHLNQCADCREVVAFSVPEEAAAAETRPLAARRGWNPWPVLRWGALAAVLGALAIVVVLHPGMWQGRRELFRQTPPPVPAASAPQAPQAVAPPTVGQPPAEAAQARARTEAKQTAGETSTAGQARQRNLPVKDRLGRPEAGQYESTMASTQPPAKFKAAIASASRAERDEAKAASSLSAEATAPPSPPSAIGGAMELSAGASAAKRGVEARVAPEAFPAATQSVGAASKKAGAASASAKAARAEPGETASRMTPLAPMNVEEAPAARKNMRFAAQPLATRWSVSPQGEVLRSTDGGKTLARIQVAQDVRFLAIAALGSDVWAGGTGGALFHSADAGVTWRRVALDIEGTTVTQSIASIRMRDSRHLTVTTASALQWVSEDGGQHWQKRP